jgi:uncharacterized protein (DUF58 family)
MAALGMLVLLFVGAIRLWTGVSLRGLDCQVLSDKEKLFPGEKVTFALQADNRKILPLWLQILVPLRSMLKPDGSEDTTLLEEGELLWYQRARFQWEWTAAKRGVYEIGPARILAGDLFAFFTRRKQVGHMRTVLVYPRLVPLNSLSLPRRDFFGIPGSQNPIQDPVYVLGTRDYQPGRPAKYIHWKASARRSSLQEKVLEPTQQEKVLLIVDVAQFRREGAEQEFEETLERVASLAALLDRRGHALGLLTNGIVQGKGAAQVSLARSSRQLQAILEVLARLKMRPRCRIGEAMGRGALTWGLSCLCFFYREDRAVSLMDGAFQRARIPALFFVCRRAEGEEKSNLQSGPVLLLKGLDAGGAAVQS